MQPVQHILTIELFPGLGAELISVLKTIPAAAWDYPTACAGWTVQDVSAHLLGGTLGRLSFGRDKATRKKAPTAPLDFDGLLHLINEQNAEWVSAARRISPSLLIQFLELTELQLYEYFRTWSPLEIGGVSVAWAGETQSPRWFDIAREYTEKWLHQQHIREAVGWHVLDARRWLHPVLDTFMRALPYTYRNVIMPDGNAINVHISGDAGGDWSLLRVNGQWQLFVGLAEDATVAVRLDQDTAWRLLSRGISPDDARNKTTITGDAPIGSRILQMVSIMA